MVGAAPGDGPGLSASALLDVDNPMRAEHRVHRGSNRRNVIFRGCLSRLRVLGALP